MAGIGRFKLSDALGKGDGPDKGSKSDKGKAKAVDPKASSGDASSKPPGPDAARGGGSPTSRQAGGRRGK